MGLLRRRETYDRLRILREAADARACRKRRKAIELYRRVLVAEPDNPEVHARLAPLLAETGQHFDAWLSFRIVAGAALRAGEVDKAIQAYEEAARSLPRELGVWLALAKLYRKQGRKPEALQALLEGRRQLRGRRDRPRAIHLLRRALELEAWEPATVLDLARLLALGGQRYEAEHLLANLAARAPASFLRRVRAAQLRLNPTFSHLWGWLRAALSRPRPASEPPFYEANRAGLGVEPGGGS